MKNTIFGCFTSKPAGQTMRFADVSLLTTGQPFAPCFNKVVLYSGSSCSNTQGMATVRGAVDTNHSFRRVYELQSQGVAISERDA